MSEVLRKNDERTNNIDVLEMDDESISADAISDDEQAEMLKTKKQVMKVLKWRDTEKFSGEYFLKLLKYSPLTIDFVYNPLKNSIFW